MKPNKPFWVACLLSKSGNWLDVLNEIQQWLLLLCLLLSFLLLSRFRRSLYVYLVKDVDNQILFYFKIFSYM